jgi:hypothetical protein
VPCRHPAAARPSATLSRKSPARRRGSRDTPAARRRDAHFGGSGLDNASDIVVGPDGSAYITGATTSRNFPVTAGAYQTTQRGEEEGFVVKFSPSGIQPGAPNIADPTAPLGGGQIVIHPR